MAANELKAIQDKADQFHMMMGYCIAEWARIEDHLFRICHAVLRCPKEQAAVVYYKSPSVESRMTLIGELVNLVLPKYEIGTQPHDDSKFWRDIRKQIGEILPTRNRIAHHPVDLKVSAFYLGVGFMDVPLESWFEIYESQNEQLRERSKGKSPLKITDLHIHLKRTAEISSLLHRFYYERLVNHISSLPLR